MSQPWSRAPSLADRAPLARVAWQVELDGASGQALLRGGWRGQVSLELGLGIRPTLGEYHRCERRIMQWTAGPRHRLAHSVRPDHCHVRYPGVELLSSGSSKVATGTSWGWVLLHRWPRSPRWQAGGNALGQCRLRQHHTTLTGKRARSASSWRYGRLAAAPPFGPTPMGTLLIGQPTPNGLASLLTDLAPDRAPRPSMAKGFKVLKTLGWKCPTKIAAQRRPPASPGTGPAVGGHLSWPMAPGWSRRRRRSGPWPPGNWGAGPKPGLPITVPPWSGPARP